ncbi:MDR family MFS transporter [Neobacillus rhizophilus]|uniref:MFS transporter n=1 Tax=Neobacillus rhizophilus TaxID=2833579 RepID=A0A942U4T9_9BACI|nr:MDR family MFS transporter [Neobacillus rhizophilus]MBS4214705.1 MFS transporter [Neobacillus rhizophilus]
MENLVLRKKLIIMLSVMSAMLFASLNQTIVVTALPTIISDLNGINYYSWVFTMFMLASSVTSILVGKLSDIYGRKIFILIGISVFTIGSFLCGLSDSMIKLILFRGIQGFGAGMIMSTAFTIVGDLFSPRERGKWQGFMSSVFGISSMCGPTIGGWIADNADWHWVFWVFLPLGIVAFLMILFIYPSQAVKTKESIDYYGSLFISLTIVPLLLALTWGGRNYGWISSIIIFLFVCSACAFLFFIYSEKRASSPVLPLSLFKNDIYSLSNFIAFLLGMGMFGTIMYMPYFIQGVIGTSATKSGLIMMPMILSMVFANVICGQLMSKTGKYKIFVIIGLLIMGSGMLLLSFLNIYSTTLRIVVNIIMIGFGLGLSTPVVLLSVQNAVPQRILGVATSSVQLFRQLGGTVGVAVMGTIMNLKLQFELTGLSKESDLYSVIEQNSTFKKLQDPEILMNHKEIENIKESLTPEMQETLIQISDMIREALGHSLTFAFLLTSIFLSIGFVLSFFLKEIPFRRSNRTNVAPGLPPEKKEPSTYYK